MLHELRLKGGMEPANTDAYVWVHVTFVRVFQFVCEREKVCVCVCLCVCVCVCCVFVCVMA